MYDVANRLSSVDTVSYTFDDNGNLLGDGTNTYTYDSANRLISDGTTTYAYNGLGDRYQQTVSSQTTTYVLDLNTGLTQVLDDGDNTYFYGLGRIAQVNTSTDYFMGDALGSVRQLVEGGDIVLAKSYAPYGEDLYSTGSGESSFAYTGEQTDPNGLVYLRARYYEPDIARFVAKDKWYGNHKIPSSLNKWLYAESNPIMKTDPSGYCSQSGWDDPEGIFTEANCDKLEAGDLEFTEEWYYAFADYIQDDLPQTSANMRHYLDGSGSELQLQPSFMENRIYEWPELRDSVNELATWYVRTYFDQGNNCPITVGPDIYARAFTPPYQQAWKYWPGDKSQLDISGSLGTFRLDAEIQGTLDNYQNSFWVDKLGTDLSLHLVVLDLYNWHEGLNHINPFRAFAR